MKEVTCSASVPASVAQEYVMSSKLKKQWAEVGSFIKLGHEKFLSLYEKTISELLGDDWKDRWQSDPFFPEQLAKVEDSVRTVCVDAGLSKSSFNRYRAA